MTEDQLEQEVLDWLQEVGYSVLHGVDVAPDSDHPERKDYRQVLLLDRLRSAIARLNPSIPLVAQEDAIKQIQDLGVPDQLAANKRFHHTLVICFADTRFSGILRYKACQEPAAGSGFRMTCLVDFP